MVRLNPLQRNVLITNHEVIFHAPTQHTLDPRSIQQAIIIAEERFIRPALGEDLYEEMLAQKNTEVTGENLAAQQQLLNTSMAGTQNIPVLKEGDIVNNTDGLSANNRTLWKQHLWKLTAECVLLVAFPDGFVQFASSGIVHNNPPANLMMTTQSNLTTPELKSVRWMMDKKLMDRIDPLIEAMHTWICKRKDQYPLYDKPCDCDAKGAPFQKKTDWVMGLYDDEEKNCGCV